MVGEKISQRQAKEVRNKKKRWRMIFLQGVVKPKIVNVTQELYRLHSKRSKVFERLA
jgi:hypothetical protein